MQNSQIYARTYPVDAIWDGNLTYPPSYDKDGDQDERLIYSYGSFVKQPLTYEATQSNWMLCVRVPIPSNCNNPVLLALNYMIRYSTYHSQDSGGVIQIDIILTTRTLSENVIVDVADLGVYKNKTGFGPYMIDHEAALCLSSTVATKAAAEEGRYWGSHFVDNQQITPKVRVANSNVARLYLVFHSSEPLVKKNGNLSVDVSAAWQKEEVEKKAKECAERKAKEEADKKAKKDAEKKAKWEEERQARAEEMRAREEESRHREGIRLGYY